MRVQDKRKSAKAAESQHAVAPADEAGVDAISSAAPPGSPEEGAAPEEQHDYLGDLQRLQAEFQNYRKRVMKEQAEFGDRAVARFVEQLLPVVDNFERALTHGDAGEGVALVFKELRGVLESTGLEEVPADGVTFDPSVHEAVEMHDDETVAEPTCRTVHRKGYRFKGHLLRPAMVVVAQPVSQTDDVSTRSES